MLLNLTYLILPLDNIFAKLSDAAKTHRISNLVIFAGHNLVMADRVAAFIRPASDQISRAAAAANFSGFSGSSLEIFLPEGISVERLLIIGIDSKDGADPDVREADSQPESQKFLNLGGQTISLVENSIDAVIIFEFPNPPACASSAAASFALGGWLRDYRFDQYKTKKHNVSSPGAPINIHLAVYDPKITRPLIDENLYLAEAITLCRNLVNEPANVLTPDEFTSRASVLMKLGVQISVLDEQDMATLGMHALIGVGDGSGAKSRLVTLHWNGSNNSEKKAPIAFVGKGVVFDSGGISIKQADGMEDMKADMAGAAAITGALYAIAARKSRSNIIGILALVENMPDGKAQRPGDIVKSMSGQTIEIVNTDAEGRLIIADALTYVIGKHHPSAVIDFATLTGAMITTLGHEYAGLFANNDQLANQLTESATSVGENLWRMPMGPSYDKLINSKFADMKNTAGPAAGAINAAQFLMRFVGMTPWAHIDMGGPAIAVSSYTNQSWATGWGVRLIDRFVRDYCEG